MITVEFLGPIRKKPLKIEAKSLKEVAAKERWSITKVPQQPSTIYFKKEESKQRWSQVSSLKNIIAPILVLSLIKRF